MKTHAFTIYNASAGSGKTYTLTKEYLKIILTSAQNDAYKRILAITFTNKAVEEMKTRIVDNLYDFSKQETSPKGSTLLADIAKETQLSINTLKEKAKEVIKNIIHNYTAFGISTIDKFTHKVIRSFAQGLNLPSNFEVTLETDTLLQEAVDIVISKVGEDEKLTQFLVDFTKSKTDDDKSWDVSKELFEIAKLITNENNVEELELFSTKKITDFVTAKNKLKKEIKKLEEESKQIGSNIFTILNENSIVLSSFYTSFSNHLNAIVNFTVKPTHKKYFEPTDIKVKKAAENKGRIEQLKPQLLQQLALVYTKYGKIAFYTAFLKNINPLSLLNAVNIAFKELQEEQNTVAISNFNTLIFNELKNQPVPFIYEGLGEKYRHYFIDEFQDTSEMQWQNLVPLIDNALSSEENNNKGTLMIVGDPKQAIYRWRGGKAEQFIALSKKENPKNKAENPFSNKDKTIINLDTNYRSYSEIITFNNRFFNFLSAKFENPDYIDLYKNKSYQKTNHRIGGYVNLSFINNETHNYNEDELEHSIKTQLFLDATLATILKIKKQGYSLGDIALLIRKKNQGVVLANYLTEKGIPILSSETLLIQNATEVKLLLALLRYLNNNKDNESKVYFLYYIARFLQKKLPVHNFIVATKDLSEKELETFLQSYNFTISFQSCRKKSLYDTVEFLIATFISATANTSYVQYFLDLVLEKDLQHQSGIASFLDYWGTTGYKKSIPSPENNKAVKIMTIHKSKGLEFPIVIYPFAEENFSNKPNNKLWLTFDETTSINLPKALVNSTKEVPSYSSKAETIYHNSQQEELLDNINVLYVALTRPEQQLYIISAINKTKTGNLQNNLSSYFIEFLQFENTYTDDCLEYEYGNPLTITSVNESNNNDEIVQNTITLVNKKLPFKNIKIAKKEALMWNTNQNDAIAFGNILHEIMAYITTKKDVSSAIEIALENGIITENNVAEITTTIHKIINHPQLISFFKATHIVYNEYTIIDSNLGNIKPDRIEIDKKNAYLLDYKTGDKKEQHKKQIEKYATALQQMNYNVQQKALVYIDANVEVVFV